MSQKSSDCPGYAGTVWQLITKLSSFRDLLETRCQSFSSMYGSSFEINPRALTSAFFAWTHTIESTEAYLQRNPLDYFQYSVGSLLAELLKANVVSFRPLSINEITTQEHSNSIAEWWPSGFFLTHFSVELIQNIATQECGRELAPSDKIGNFQLWQSFRENLLEQPSIAIAYFDNFMGITPNWRLPGVIRERPAAANAHGVTA